jgi:hypothetical protein
VTEKTGKRDRSPADTLADAAKFLREMRMISSAFTTNSSTARYLSARKAVALVLQSAADAWAEDPDNHPANDHEGDLLALAEDLIREDG